jgi:ADP-heptose:LPS heptosyltransferase
MLTNDTGPMHLAVALGCPTVGLFGPGSPDHYGVEGPGVEILYHPVACSPCIYETDQVPCAGRNVCMQIISVEEVLLAMERSLRAGRYGVGRKEPAEVPYEGPDGRMLGLIARESVCY